MGFAAFNIRRMAQSWLVLDMTDSTLSVGVVAGASTVTVMAFSLVAEPPPDRRRRAAHVPTPTHPMCFEMALRSSSPFSCHQPWSIVRSVPIEKWRTPMSRYCFASPTVAISALG